MSRPGYVVRPDGHREFVQDKLAYVQQHPKSLESTLAAHKKHAEGRQRIEAKLADQKIQGKEFRRQEKVKLEGEELYHHWCVKGRVVRDCDACNSSWYLPGGPDSTELPCKKCEATKLLWSDCLICKEVTVDETSKPVAVDDDRTAAPQA